MLLSHYTFLSQARILRCQSWCLGKSWIYHLPPLKMNSSLIQYSRLYLKLSPIIKHIILPSTHCCRYPIHELPEYNTIIRKNWYMPRAGIEPMSRTVASVRQEGQMPSKFGVWLWSCMSPNFIVRSANHYTIRDHHAGSIAVL